MNRDLSILRHRLRLAAERGELAAVPKIRLEREQQGRLRFLSEEEATRLFTECRRAAAQPVTSCRSPQLPAVVTLALNTGMRRGEILGLTWDRVDFSRGVLLLEKTKSGHRREVPMNRGVYDALSPLARSEAGRAFDGGFRTAFESAVSRAKLADFKFHHLWHTFASCLVMRGRPAQGGPGAARPSDDRDDDAVCPPVAGSAPGRRSGARGRHWSARVQHNVST